MSPMTDRLIDYRTWGTEFFRQAVTEDRVLRGVNALAGRPIEVGPMGVGPGRFAKASAIGHIGQATGQRVADEPLTFRVLLPVPIDLTIDLGMDKHRFKAEIAVPLSIAAHAREDLAIVIDVAPPSAAEVEVRLEAQGLRAQLMQAVAGVEGELRRFVSRYVRRELTKPYVEAALTIDVATAIEQAEKEMRR